MEKEKICRLLFWFACFGRQSRALNEEGLPRMRSKCRLQSLTPPCYGPMRAVRLDHHVSVSTHEAAINHV